MIIRGTTPTLVFKFKDKSGEYVDLSTYHCYLTIEEKDKQEMTFGNDRITFNADKSFQIKLTQKETLALSHKRLSIQLRFALDEENSFASDVTYATLGEILKEGIIC